MRKLRQKSENKQPVTHSGRTFDKSGIIGPRFASQGERMLTETASVTEIACNSFFGLALIDYDGCGDCNCPYNRSHRQ